MTLSARAIRPSLFIVARARQDESVPKLANAGADRVVNPQELGAARMASFVARPHVAEFVDVVMHERSLEFRMQEYDVPEGSALAGKTLREADLRKRSGVLVLALRRVDGTFTTNPDPDIVIEPHQVLIAVGRRRRLRAPRQARPLMEHAARPTSCSISTARSRTRRRASAARCSTPSASAATNHRPTSRSAP